MPPLTLRSERSYLRTHLKHQTLCLHRHPETALVDFRAYARWKTTAREREIEKNNKVPGELRALKPFLGNIVPRPFKMLRFHLSCGDILHDVLFGTLCDS